MEDICGLCGKPGADKDAAKLRWPGQREPNTDMVHTACEMEEKVRAYKAYVAAGNDPVEHLMAVTGDK